MIPFLISAGEYWLWVGALTALPFLLFGIDRIDEDARGAYIFRVLILPGIITIWPLVLWRWYILERGRDNWQLRHLPQRSVHRPVWIILAIVIAVTLIAALGLRQTPPDDLAPILLEAPR